MDKEEFRIRADRIKEAVTIWDALEWLGLNDYVTIWGSTSKMHCPVHSPDRRASAYVYADSNVVICFKCRPEKPFDVIDLVSERKEIPAVAAMEYLEQMAGLPAFDFQKELQEEIQSMSLATQKPQDSGKLLEESFKGKMEYCRNTLSLKQYVFVWKYFDALTLAFQIKKISENEYTTRLSELIGKLEEKKATQ